MAVPVHPEDGAVPAEGSGPLRAEVLLGDCRDVLAGMDAASVDAIVTDPPAGIAFMGAAWDDFGSGSGRNGQAERDAYRAGHPARPGYGNSHGKPPTTRERDAFIAWLAGIMAEARRCVRPGGYALVWALPRTSHWTAMALEDAGWTIRDSVAHLFGSGFPKSQSCLKPAHEVWWLAKAPGALRPLQIDACRVATGEIGAPRAYEPRQDREQWRITGGSTGSGATSPAGRWPPNTLFSHHPDCRPAGVRRVRGITGGTRGLGTLFGNGATRNLGPVTDYAGAEGYESVEAWTCVDGCAVKALDEQAGPRTSGAKALHHVRTTTKGRTTWGSGQGGGILHSPPEAYPASAGSASRFFPTFGPDPQDAQWVPFRCLLCEGLCPPEHGIMRETHSQGDLSCLPVSPHASAPSVASATNPRADGNGSALPSAAVLLPLDSATNSPNNNKSAPSVARTSGNGRATTASTAHESALLSPESQIAHAVRSVANLCGSCATVIARSLAATRRGHDPALPVGWDSISGPRQLILRHSLALLAESLGPHDTIPTTASLTLWSGYVTAAINTCTTKDSGATSGESDQSASPSPDAAPPLPVERPHVPWIYVPKASRRERNQGLDGQPHAPVASYGRMAGTPEHGPKYDTPEQNNHPTVKPLGLMSWLVRLIASPGAVVLDPFCGSGSTGVACVREGFGFIGIEAEAQYVEIARARIAHEQEQQAGPLFAGVGTATSAAR